jgi:hypothetical protein
VNGSAIGEEGSEPAKLIQAALFGDVPGHVEPAWLAGGIQ